VSYTHANELERFKSAELIVFFFHLISALHELLSDNLSTGLADHTPNTCIVCTPEAFSEDEVSIVTIYMCLHNLATKYVHVVCKKKRVQIYNFNNENN